MTNATLERLAALEHEQWAHWTRYMLDPPTPENVERAGELWYVWRG